MGAYGEDGNATLVNGDQTNNSATNSGAAYTFVRDGTTWSQTNYLKPPNTTALDEFGSSVDVSGNTVVAGVPWDGGTVTTSGAAHVFAPGPPSPPPVIASQPTPSQFISTGGTATLTVGAGSDPTLTFQWFEGNSGNISNPVSGATSDTA